MDNYWCLAWTLYCILLALNVLDYATTSVVLRHFQSTGRERRPAPIWKDTRFGRWMVRRGLWKPPTERWVEWYEHELNPMAVWLLKYAGGVPALAWIKFVALMFVTIQLLLLPPFAMYYVCPVFAVLNVLYSVVVANNLRVVRKTFLRRKPHKIRVGKGVPFEGPLLPI